MKQNYYLSFLPTINPVSIMNNFEGENKKTQLKIV